MLPVVRRGLSRVWIDTLTGSLCVSLMLGAVVVLCARRVDLKKPENGYKAAISLLIRIAGVCAVYWLTGEASG